MEFFFWTATLTEFLVSVLLPIFEIIPISGLACGLCTPSGLSCGVLCLSRYLLMARSIESSHFLGDTE